MGMLIRFCTDRNEDHLYHNRNGLWEDVEKFSLQSNSFERTHRVCMLDEYENLVVMCITNDKEVYEIFQEMCVRISHGLCSPHAMDYIMEIYAELQSTLGELFYCTNPPKARGGAELYAMNMHLDVDAKNLRYHMLAYELQH